MSNLVDFYFVAVVACLSFLADLSLFVIFCWRWFGHSKPRRWNLIRIIIDTLLAMFWGLGVAFSIVHFQCPVGWYNHW